jgi:hypothetical protein
MRSYRVAKFNSLLVGDDGVVQGFKAEKFVLAANNRRYDTLPSINDAEGTR